MNRLRFSLLCTLFLSFVLISVVNADDGSDYGNDVIVDYYGSKVSLRWLESQRVVGCHDAEGQGQLTCFDTVDETYKDVIRRGMAPSEIRDMFTEEVNISTEAQELEATTTTTMGGSDCYSMLWSENYYTGNHFLLCYDYNDLRSVGWNDRARSLEAYDPTTMWEHINYDPNGQMLSTAISLPNLAEWGWDRRISSISRRP